MFLAFVTLFSVSFMSSCKDAEVEDAGSPSLILSTNALAFDVDGVSSDEYAGQVTITSNRDWVVEIPSSKEWLTVDVAEGSNNATITFFVEATTAARDANVSIKLYNDSGFILDETIVVTQYGAGGNTGEESGEIIFYEPMGSTAVSDNTYVDQFDAWATEGTGASTVTFDGSGTSIRSSGLASSGYYTDASGVNNLFFGAAPATFTVQNITLAENQKNLRITFGANRYVYDSKDDTFYNESLVVALSADGTTWCDITYVYEPGDGWGFATADFTLSEPTTSLYIRYTASESSIIRVDDVTLSTGIGGASVDLSQGNVEEPSEVENTIGSASIAANAGNSFDVSGTVWATTMASYLVGDETGAILVYAGYGLVDYAVGDVLNIAGETTSYGGFGQFTSTATITKSGTSDFTYPTPTEMSGSDLDSYLNSSSIKYVKYTGTLSVSGNYTNITIDGASSAKGSICYAADGLYDSSLVDQKVDVYGYLAGVTGTVYVQTIAVCIVAEGDDFVLPEIGGGSTEEPNEDDFEYVAGDLTLGADSGFPTEGSSDDAVVVAADASFVVNNLYFNDNYNSFSISSGGYIYNLTAFEGLTQVVITEDYQYYNFTLYAGTSVNPTTEVKYTKEGNYYVYDIPAGSKYIAIANESTYTASGDLFDFYFDSLGDTAEYEGGSTEDETALNVKLTASTFLPSDYTFEAVSTGYDLAGSYDVDPINLNFVSTGTSTRVWCNTDWSTELRFYNGSTTTISSSTVTITKIVFGNSVSSNFAFDSGTLDGKTWSGSASSVVISCSATTKPGTITVYYE